MSSPSSNLQGNNARKPLGVRLGRLYAVYSDPRWISPDPLELVLPFRTVADREIAALAASSLAYGRVAQILKSLRAVFGVMGGSPADYIRSGSETQFRRDFRGFKHRFHTGEDLALLFAGVRDVLERCGSLETCFAEGFDADRDETVLPAAERFCGELCHRFPGGESTLLPSPSRGSACKRLNLMLRWLVRHDAVDPGGWTRIPASHLVIPLDTHMHRIARELGLTSRKAADLRTALEVTRVFRTMFPEDPVKLDFVLTRFGINPEFGENPLEKC
ncbi:MAG TPA: TIGR02757 family protein [Lentisphaeria bacterium]|nr:TIGR02757 family protein [Lentisphaeria bacterium]